jgi:hypothetical protein
VRGVLRTGFPANGLGVGYDMDEVETVATQALAEQLGVSGKDGDLRAQIARVIARMLDRDMQGLFTMFYRLDIAEAKVRQVFDESQTPDVPEALTTLVVDREIARQRSWLQHARTQKDLCP